MRGAMPVAGTFLGDQPDYVRAHGGVEGPLIRAVSHMECETRPYCFAKAGDV